MDHKARGAGGPGLSAAEVDGSREYRSAPGADDPEDLAADSDSAPADEGSVRVFNAAAPDHGVRLDRALAAWLPAYSRSHLQTLIDAGAVCIDGRVTTSASRRIGIGMRVEIVLTPPLSQQPFEPEPMALDVRHEDPHLMVLCKPAGLVVHPAAGHWTGTLLNGLLAHDPGAALLPRAGIVHRLDKDTSGLMVVARTLEAMTGLVRLLARHEVHRAYRAIAHGVLEPPMRTFDGPIGRDPRSRVRMAVVAGGKSARTDVVRVATDGRYSALECRLHTGRTHQIRVHLAHAGHPLVGDSVYGGRPELGLARQALHAFELRFEHPVGGPPVSVRAEPPQDFAAAWSQVTGIAGSTATDLP